MMIGHLHLQLVANIVVTRPVDQHAKKMTVYCIYLLYCQITNLRLIF